MLKPQEQPHSEQQQPAKPVLTVIEKGKIVSVTGYRKLEIEPDKSIWAGLVGSLLIHVALFASAACVWHSFHPEQPAGGDDKSRVFDVELVDASVIVGPPSVSEAATLPSPAVEAPEPIEQLKEQKPVEKKAVENKQKAKTTSETPSSKSSLKASDTQASANPGDGQQGTSFGISGGNGTAKPDYAQVVAARIAAHKSYPRRARERGIEGRVVVELTVSKAGEVVESQVVSTDSNLLSNGVDEMIRRASPFPAIPAELNTSELTLQVPIKFNLEE